MFWERVLESLKAQGTIWAIFLGIALLALIFIKVVEWASIAFVKYVSLPAIRWPRITLPNVAWKRVSEPVKKGLLKILAVLAVVAIGIVVPLLLALQLAQVGGVADQVAYVTASVLLSTFVVSIGLWYLLIKQRSTLREMGAYMLLWYVIAISWLTAIIVALPMAFLSD